MPRGIPNAKKDDLGMRYTTFNVPLLANPKLTASSYLKYDQQSIWTRTNNAQRAAKPRPEDAQSQQPEGRRGSRVLVIHPGSRWLRIGRASDVAPVTVPNVIARRVRQGLLATPKHVQNIARLRQLLPPETAGSEVSKEDEYAVAVISDDPVESRIAAIKTALRDRMRFYKLRVTPNAAKIASTFNSRISGEVVPISDISDRRAPPTEDILIGEDVYELDDPPQDSNYVVRWPMYGSNFNSRDYSSHQNLLNDIEEMWRTIIRDKLDIDPKTFQEYSIVLVVPDIWDRFYVKDLIDLLLLGMGFKQVTCQQESLAATYGAGISNACVVDLGAVKTSVACVDDGLVIPDTRMTLSTAGDDVTELLAVLLERISFPYKELNLARHHDWALMEDIKCRLVTLNESDVALNLYDFVIQRPRANPVKYGLRAYDEVIIAPMVIFDPRIIEFDNKREGMRRVGQDSITDEVVECITDRLTNAMLISTQHLYTQMNPPAPNTVSVPASGAGTPQPGEGSNTKVEEKPATLERTDSQADTIDIEITDTASQENASRQAEKHEPGQSGAATPSQQQQQENPPAKSPDANQSTSGAAPGSSQTLQPTFIGGYPIDVPFEASKLPLDVAIYNSARSAGGDDRIRKYLQAVLVVGGGALTAGMAHALESRLQAIATPLVPNMEKVQIIPPPKDVDPRMLVWKGAAVFGKMDALADLWITAADWKLFGMRALKERCFYL